MLQITSLAHHDYILDFFLESEGRCHEPGATGKQREREVLGAG